MFVDIHNHIIPGVDDGPDDISTSIEMLRIACEEGIGKIIATPHFIHGEINNTPQRITDGGAAVLDAARNGGIELLFGSEIFIFPELASLVKAGAVQTLNKSRYILLEFPSIGFPTYAAELLFSLQLMGYRPIIAHPERNKVFQSDQEQLFRLVERGVLTQVNTTSITKLYGREVQKAAFNFIACELVHFVASDAHSTRNRAPRMSMAHKAIVSEFGRDIADKLFFNNGQKVIDNDEIIFQPPVRKRKKIFI